MSRSTDPEHVTGHPTVVKVAAALTEAGLPESADRIRVLPSEARTATLAAQALGVDVGAIANSLVFRMTTSGGTSAPLLVLTSGAHRADTGVLAALTGARSVDKADPEFVRTHTGQAIGGVAPVGHPGRITTLVDEALRSHDTVWAAAGHPSTVFPTTFAELLEATAGTSAVVSGPRDGAAGAGSNRRSSERTVPR